MIKRELHHEPGLLGLFTRDEAEGGAPNGTRMVKVASVPDDAHQDNAGCVVVGSIANERGELGHFVLWDDLPDTVVFITADRLDKEDRGN